MLTMNDVSNSVPTQWANAPLPGVPGGPVSVLVGDFSRNLSGQGEEFISSRQQGVVLHAKLSGCFVNSELSIQK